MDKEKLKRYIVFVVAMAIVAVVFFPYSTVHKVDRQIWYYSSNYSTIDSLSSNSELTYSSSAVLRWISGMPYGSNDLKSSWYVLRVENISYRANRCGDWDYISIANNGSLDLSVCDTIWANNIYIEQGSKLITKEMFWVTGQELYIKPVEKPHQEQYWQ